MVEFNILQTLYHFGLLSFAELHKKTQCDLFALDARLDDLAEKGMVRFYPSALGRHVFLAIPGYREFLTIRGRL